MGTLKSLPLKALLVVFASSVILLNPSWPAMAQSTGAPCPSCPGVQPTWQSMAGDPELSREMQAHYQMAEEDRDGRRWDEAVMKYRTITENYPSTPQIKFLWTEGPGLCIEEQGDGVIGR